MSDILLPGSPNNSISRRTLLKSGLILLAGAALPTEALARLAQKSLPERSLSFYNTHTGEQLKRVVYWSNGRYVPEHLRQINRILRDHRTDEIRKIDVELLDMLFTVQSRMQVREPLHIISGYRSQQSNAQLRKKSKGVAKKSLHTKGQAIDFRIPGRNLRDVRKVALAMKQGGVGFYPGSEFVHIDTGPFRSW